MAVDTTSRRGVLPSLAGLTHHRELLRTLFRRELRARYKGSGLGIVWTLIYPLAMMGVYTLVFAVLWRTTGDIPHYPLFVLTGLSVWGFFQASIQLGSSSLIGSADLIKKVWFPRELIPAAAVLGQTVVAGIMFGIMIPVNLSFVPETARTLALVVPFFAALFCLAIGLAWIFSVANVFFRDIEHLLAVLFLPWFFLTPVLYGLDLFPAAAAHPWVIHLMRYANPVTPYVEGIRAVTLQAVVPGASLLIYMFVVGPLAALVGLWVVQRYEDRIAIDL